MINISGKIKLILAAGTIATDISARDISLSNTEKLIRRGEESTYTARVNLDYQYFGTNFVAINQYRLDQARLSQDLTDLSCYLIAYPEHKTTNTIDGVEAQKQAIALEGEAELLNRQARKITYPLRNLLEVHIRAKETSQNEDFPSSLRKRAAAIETQTRNLLKEHRASYDIPLNLAEELEKSWKGINHEIEMQELRADKGESKSKGDHRATSAIKKPGLLGIFTVISLVAFLRYSRKDEQ